jgi:peptide/nickel transport system permease protein
MASFTLRRILMLIPILIGITFIIFALLFILPGDPVRLIAGPGATPETIESIRHEMGLDRPLHTQYLDYLSKMAVGDLGRSYQTRRRVTEELAAVVPRTVQLALVAEIISSVFGILLGMIAAARQNDWPDRLITVLAALQLSFPAFWLALMLQLLFAVKLHWLPSSGYENGFDKFIILPAITMAIASTGILARLTRVAVLDTLREDYIRTGRAKGLRELKVFVQHALPNALIPITTTIGLDLARLIGGITIIEVIFSWPGLGKYAFDALVFRDLPALQASVIVFAVFVTLINLFVDLLYRIIDPRISRTA